MLRPLSLLLVAAPCATAAPQPPATPVPAYEFFLDEAPYEPARIAIEGTATQPREGDLVWVAGVWLVLGEPGTYRFDQDTSSCTDHRRRVWCTRDGNRALVGLLLKDLAHTQDLTAADWRSLRGLCFEAWNPEIAACLTGITAARCHLDFGVFADFDELPDFPIDLQYLDLDFAEPRSLAGIERLTSLRHLQLPRRYAGPSIEWVKRMPALCRLSVDGTSVTDLTPLDGHPSLRRVFASNTPLTRLPTRRLPALEEFRAHSTGCPVDEAARFRKLQNGARVTLSNREALLEGIRGATRLRLREGSTCHPRPQDRQLYETDDAAEIARVIALLQTEETHCGLFMIPGCEQHALVFLDAKGAVLVEVGVFGASTLRCPKLWNTEPSVPAAAQEPLRAWLRSRGANPLLLD
ncbi:MAG: hypothetical protein WAT39_08230 [Planctomycetota bacterium]